jgi:arylsulfatase A-like enzyme
MDSGMRRSGRDAAFDEAALDDKPAYVRRKSPLDDRDERRLDQLERDRLATLFAVDEAIAAIGETLDAEGRLEDTYVFVLSDNGFLLGDHRMEGKGSPYDGSVRVPMLAWGPKFDRGTDERLVGNIDIAPTIADVAGVRLPAADGQSLLDRSAREAILLERFKEGAKPTYEAIRTARWLYVEYATGETELYDYREDPDETNNLLAEANEDEGDRNAEVGALSRLLAELAGCKREGCRAAGQG